MPRFFFDVYDGIAMPDSTGQDCADIHDARRRAALRAAELLRGAPDRLWRDGDWTVWIRDERGLQLFSIVVLGMLAPAGRSALGVDAAVPKDAAPAPSIGDDQ